MKNKIFASLVIALGFGLALGLTARPARAQSPTPTPTPYEPAQEMLGGYGVTSSIEFGVRGISVTGNDRQYRSDLNYRPGFRIFDSSFLMRSPQVKGKPFDTFLVTSSGWGADPNGHTRISLEKTGAYRFDSNVRRFTYFNNLSNHALGEHTANTRHRLGDFDLTLFPQKETFKLKLGYSFGRYTGPGSITYSYNRDEFPIPAVNDSRTNDFRAGVDSKVLGFSLSLTQGYRYFKDDTFFIISSLALGNNPSLNSSINTLSRKQPNAGHTNFTRFSANRLFGKRFDFTGRYIYSSTTSRFVYSDRISGRDNSGNIITLDAVDINADTKRSNGNGDVGFTWLATDKFRISETFSVNAFRLTGGNIVYQNLARTTAAGVPLTTTITNTLAHRLINYRRITNLIEADYQFNANYAFHVGYRYSKRRVILDDYDRNLVTGTTTDPAAEEEDNVAHAFVGGFKIKPVKRWTNFFDMESGHSDNPFSRLANYKYTNLRARSRLDVTDNFQLNFSVITRDNHQPSRADLSPTSNFDADINNRIYNGSFDWSIGSRVTLNGGYNYQHLTSEAAVIINTGTTGQGVARYFLREHSAYLDAYIRFHPRISLYGSYRVNKDNGTDRVPVSTKELIDTYPLTFTSPEVRLAFKLSRRVDWNIGYQYYDYDEKVIGTRNYRAHLPYTSLRIYIGGNDR